MKIILIAGLGNPGKKYEATRHNAGFIFADQFRKKLGFPDWAFKKKFDALVAHQVINRKKIILMKPQTFMNLSGKAVSSAMKYYETGFADFMVIHDEIGLPLGRWKISADSRAAGHNGVQNIIDELGTKNFIRLRLGIDNREKPANSTSKMIPTEKFVLGKFRQAEMKILIKQIDDASSELVKLLLH